MKTSKPLLIQAIATAALLLTTFLVVFDFCTSWLFVVDYIFLVFFLFVLVVLAPTTVLYFTSLGKKNYKILNKIVKYFSITSIVFLSLSIFLVIGDNFLKIPLLSLLEGSSLSGVLKFYFSAEYILHPEWGLLNDIYDSAPAVALALFVVVLVIILKNLKNLKLK